MEDNLIVKNGKQLRCGYTTGSCAAAAAKAAALMLLSGQKVEKVGLITPKGIRLDLPVQDIRMEPNRVSCAIQKDSGDDPDITNGALIYAEVTLIKEPCIRIDGGIGVGRVTKPGLDQPVGAAAINSTPRKMIREALEEVCDALDYPHGFSVVISVPNGEALAEKTFNSRLGIIGGISIIGTTGIVEPMSDQALIDTITLELNQRRVNGAEYVLLTPGNYGMTFLQDQLHIAPELPVMTSNFIGDALDACKTLGYRGILLTGHIGKMVKLAGGMMNTHSRYGDCRMEIMAAHAAACGLRADSAAEMLECVTCDDALRILHEEGLAEHTMDRIIRAVGSHLNHRTGSDPEVGTILFSNVYGLLGKTDNADDLLRKIMED